MDGRYLLVRSVDHVVLGVQFTQMELVAPGGLSPPSPRAAGPTSSLVLTFPPQHITEQVIGPGLSADSGVFDEPFDPLGDRKSTRLNSSHGSISYAVFCLKKKKK